VGIARKFQSSRFPLFTLSNSAYFSDSIPDIIKNLSDNALGTHWSLHSWTTGSSHLSYFCSFDFLHEWRNVLQRRYPNPGPCPDKRVQSQVFSLKEHMHSHAVNEILELYYTSSLDIRDLQKTEWVTLPSPFTDFSPPAPPHLPSQYPGNLHEPSHVSSKTPSPAPNESALTSKWNTRPCSPPRSFPLHLCPVAPRITEPGPIVSSDINQWGYRRLCSYTA